MSRESLLLIFELRSRINMGPVTLPDFEKEALRLLQLKKETEQELARGNPDPDITVS